MRSSFLISVATIVPLALGVMVPYVWSDDTAEDFVCAQRMSTEGQAALTEYQTLLNEFYLADQPTSAQVSEAVDYYRAFQDELARIYEEGSAVDSPKSIDLANNEIAACLSVQSTLLQTAQVYLRGYTLSSSNTKRNFRIHDAFDVFNQDMDDFLSDFQATFPGQFQRFNNALPCYARECL